MTNILYFNFTVHKYEMKSRRNETKTKTDLIISGIDIAFMNSIPHMR